MEWTTFLAFAALGKIFGHKSSGFVIPARGTVTFRLIRNDRMRFLGGQPSRWRHRRASCPLPARTFQAFVIKRFFRAPRQNRKTAGACAPTVIPEPVCS
jgi:hypothetical protein